MRCKIAVYLFSGIFSAVTLLVAVSEFLSIIFVSILDNFCNDNLPPSDLLFFNVLIISHNLSFAGVQFALPVHNILLLPLSTHYP